MIKNMGRGVKRPLTLRDVIVPALVVLVIVLAGLDSAYWQVLPADLSFLTPWTEASLNLLAVVLAACIFVAGWFVLGEQYPVNMLVLTICFFVAGVLDAAHMLLMYAGSSTPAASTQLLSSSYWMTARILTAVGLFVWLLPRWSTNVIDARRARASSLIAGLVLSCVALTAWWFFSANSVVTDSLTSDLLTSDLLTPGTQTPMFRSLVFVINMALYAGAYHLSRNNPGMSSENSAVGAGIALIAGSEVLFSVTVTNSDFSTLIGHIFKAVGTVLICFAVFVNTIRFPVDRLRDAHRKLKVFASRLDNLLSASPDGVIGIKRDGTIIYTNPRAALLFGYAPDELIGNSIEMLLPAGMRENHVKLREGYASSPTERPMSARNGLIGRRKDGSDVPIDIAIGQGSKRDDWYLTAYIRDMTERRQLELEMEKRASVDMLTGLSNRSSLQEKLSGAIANASASGQPFCLLMIDLDGFKDINDAWGHGLGDKLLKEIAQRLLTTMNDGDIVARLGGDEFVVISHSCRDTVSALQQAQNLLSVIASDINIEPHQFSLSASIGIAQYPNHAPDHELLLGYADIAMYSAKSSGKNIAKVFDPAMLQLQQHHLSLKSLIRQALDNGEFKLFFQPQFCTRDDTIIGFEALIRWRMNNGEWMSPDRFIPIAERTGLIVPITEWVISATCAQLSLWRELEFNVPVSVNVSAVHFRREGELTAFMEKMLRVTGLNPSLLGVELTETALMENAAVASATLSRLVDLGIKVSIDDFGTGYSSLASLEQYPLHVIKLDRRFMQGLTGESKSASIVKALIDLSSSLGMEVLAEGVETDDQLQILRKAGCHAIQGWVRHPALSSNDATRLLRQCREAYRKEAERAFAALSVQPLSNFANVLTVAQ